MIRWRNIMEQKIKIRNEEKADYEIVERITREAFYNLYIPGCVEHYLVHIMRSHKDFIPELDFVLELNGNIIGNIMYTKAKLMDENGGMKEVLTFGPVSILPTCIFGSPVNYVSRGFKSCKKYNVCIENGKYPSPMMVKELIPDALAGHKWIYQESDIMAVSEEQAQNYDNTLEKLERKYQPSQDEFYIMSHSFIEE